MLKSLNYERLDTSQKPFYLLFCVQHWLTLVLDCVQVGFVLLIVGLIIGLKDRISAGFAGVALSNLINLSSLMSNLVMVWTQLETSMASVERIKTFKESTPSENMVTENLMPPDNWPSQGSIEFKGIDVTYK